MGSRNNTLSAKHVILLALAIFSVCPSRASSPEVARLLLRYADSINTIFEKIEFNNNFSPTDVESDFINAFCRRGIVLFEGAAVDGATIAKAKLSDDADYFFRGGSGRVKACIISIRRHLSLVEAKRAGIPTSRIKAEYIGPLRALQVALNNASTFINDSPANLDGPLANLWVKTRRDAISQVDQIKVPTATLLDSLSTEERYDGSYSVEEDKIYAGTRTVKGHCKNESRTFFYASKEIDAVIWTVSGNGRVFEPGLSLDASIRKACARR